MISANWLQARAKHRQSLIELEGEARFDGLQRFFGTVHHLTAERRLSRLAFLARR
jgi:hypothetical protein